MDYKTYVFENKKVNPFTKGDFFFGLWERLRINAFPKNMIIEFVPETKEIVVGELICEQYTYINTLHVSDDQWFSVTYFSILGTWYHYKNSDSLVELSL